MSILKAEIFTWNEKEMYTLKIISWWKRGEWIYFEYKSKTIFLNKLESVRRLGEMNMNYRLFSTLYAEKEFILSGFVYDFLSQRLQTTISLASYNFSDLCNTTSLSESYPLIVILIPKFMFPALFLQTIQDLVLFVHNTAHIPENCPL